jgi:DNA helicase-2/ATP-dependent DNA helicase PcrA
MAELIEKISRPRDISKDERCIVLSTVHGSKGLESDNVFVCGVSDGLFPLASGDQEEELRLFYVAVTRAKTNLWVTGCRTYGKKEFASNSYMNYIVNI